MKRLISIFGVAILIVFLTPLVNVFAEEYEFGNGLLDNENIIKDSNFPTEWFDNDIDSYAELDLTTYYIDFNNYLNINKMFLRISGSFGGALTVYFFDEETNEIFKRQFTTSFNDYFDLNLENVLRIEVERAKSTPTSIYEIEFFGAINDIPIEVLQPIKNLNYEVTETTAIFNYDIPESENFSHVNIYFYNDILQTTDTTFVLENLLPNTNYEITFKTVNTEGIESVGITVNFKTDDLPPPPPIEETDIHNLKAEVSADRVDLSWNNPKTDKFEKAIIYRATLTSNQQTSFLDYFKPLTIHADELKPIFETNGTTFADLTIQPEQQYQYKVTAIIDGTETEGATVTTDPIPKPPPPPPFELKEIELPFTVGNIIKSAFEFIALFGAFILLALAIRLTPRLVKLIRRSSANRSRAR